jgi:two-component system, NtrC family, response regulator AtoC
MQSARLFPGSRSQQGPRIVVLDSDPAILDFVGRVLTASFSPCLLSNPDELTDEHCRSSALECVLLDWHLGGSANGEVCLSVLKRIHAIRPSVPVVLLSCSANLHDVMLANRMGAAEFLLKPFTRSDIDRIVKQYIPEAEGFQPQASETLLDENTSFVRYSKRMREIESQCNLVARTDIPVLILGESGTGKEIAAKYIHKMSARSQRGFLKVNCAAMPLDLLESELFGYEQGAFTGAVKSKPGKFEMCENGTIFLDEIGEMPPALQAKLLQVLQDGTFSRLGSRVSIKVDVRVIAATNINIKTAMAQKQFREDLYYRLNGFGFTIPPLRERREEIPLMARHFMSRISARYGREPLPISGLLMQALTCYSWPGNLRELENTIKRYIVLEDERSILTELNPHFSLELGGIDSSSPESGRNLKGVVKGLKEGTESLIIAQALEERNWNRKAAASDLQISYKALLYKIKQYQLIEARSA